MALIELESADGKELLEAEMSPTRLRLLNVREGARVFARPLKMQVFEENKDSEEVA